MGNSRGFKVGDSIITKKAIDTAYKTYDIGMTGVVKGFAFVIEVVFDDGQRVRVTKDSIELNSGVLKERVVKRVKKEILDNRSEYDKMVCEMILGGGL